MTYDEDKILATEKEAAAVTKFLAADSELAREAQLEERRDAEWRERYTRRLKHRRWQLRFLRWVFLPLAILQGAGITTAIARTIYLSEEKPFTFTTYAGWMDMLSSPFFRQKKTVAKLPPAKQAIFTADPTQRAKPATPDQQLAIWEARPESRVFYANYIRQLVLTSLTDNHATEPLNSAKMNQLISALKYGEKLDPDNAYYNYLQAAVWLRQGLTLQPASKTGLPIYTTRNPQLLANASRQVLLANQKPYLKRYGQEIMKLRLAALPPEKSVFDRMTRFGAVQEILLSKLTPFTMVSEATPYLARQLIREGRTEDARKLLQTWQKLGLKLGGDASSFIDLLIVTDILRDGSKLYAPEYKRLGDRQAVAAIQRELPLILREYNKYVTAAIKNPAYTQLAKTHGGFLYSNLYPLLWHGMPTQEELAPERWLEFIYLDYLAGFFFILGTSLSLVFGYPSFLFRRFRQGWRVKAGVFLLPDWRMLGRQIGICVVLPITGYALYTRYGTFAGREFGLSYNWAQFVTELFLLVSVVVYLLIADTLNFVRGRCRKLGIPMPEDPHVRRVKIFFLAMLAIMLLAIISQRCWHPLPATFTVALLPLLLFFPLACRFELLSSHCLRFREYYNTLNRSLFLLSAFGLLSLTFVVFPLLRWQEERELSRERIFRITPTRQEPIKSLRESFIRAESRLRKAAKIRLYEKTTCVPVG